MRNAAERRIADSMPYETSKLTSDYDQVYDFASARSKTRKKHLMDKREIKTEITRFEAKLPELAPEAQDAAGHVIAALNGLLAAGPTPDHLAALRTRLDKLADALSRS